MTTGPADAPYEVRAGDTLVSTAPARLDVEFVHGFMTASRWSAGIPRATVLRALAGSLNFGLYRDDAQIGFARFVTDRATFAYLADVYVDPAHRRQGHATRLVGAALRHPALAGLRRMLLVTRDQHALYARLGFAPIAQPERFMEIHRPDVYARGGG